MSVRPLFVAVSILISAPRLLAQGPPNPAAPVGESNPFPFLDGDGPTAAVTALAFSPDGRVLYSAGYDKVVRVWRRGAATAFQPDPGATFRLPIGPGRDGVINVLAVSPDGNWLAVSGLHQPGPAAGHDREPGPGQRRADVPSGLVVRMAFADVCRSKHGHAPPAIRKAARIA
jgi:hypothetical protein